MAQDADFSPALRQVAFSSLAGWPADDHLAAFHAYCASAEEVVAGRYRQRPLGPDAAAAEAVAQAALLADVKDGTDARTFFERWFQPYRIEDNGFLTGYFEPVLHASRTRKPGFDVPLLRRPADLCAVTDANRPEGWDPDMRFARATPNGLQPYHDRAAIRAGALNGQGLELAWLADPVDAFFIHVQGAAKLDLDPSLPAGDPARYLRVTYDGKTGHAYTSIARLLCERDGLAPAAMTADVLAQWLRDHPDERDGLIDRNRSYIFFREVKGLNPASGPVAAAKVPLCEGRSIAVDRTLHTFGSPIWLETAPLPGDDAPAARLTVAHDTGSAITGPARADLFVGSGAEAGIIAGRIRHKATLTLLLPVQT